MNIIETEDFKKDFKDLPISIRKLYQKQKEIFKQNWLDPGLHIRCYIFQNRAQERCL